MYVLPQPYAVTEKNEEFRLDYRTYLVLSKECSPRVYRQARILKEAIEKNTGLCLHLTRGEARQGDIQIQGMEGGKRYGGIPAEYFSGRCGDCRNGKFHFLGNADPDSDH